MARFVARLPAPINTAFGLKVEGILIIVSGKVKPLIPNF
jgi:hypothetical protein